MQQLRSAIHNAIARFLKNQPPARIIAVGFALLILLGAALLMLPFAVHPGAHVGPLDALFTATSAVCVTGLVVVDTGDTFSLFGQAVIAILIQIGGLGVASIGMGLALVAGRRISLKGRSLVREALNVESLEGMVRLVRAILLVTLICEVAGAVLSFPSFARDHMPLQAVWLSIFHSIAAFNNAGFDALGGGQSLIPYRNDLLLNLVREALNVESLEGMVRLVRAILLVTLICEVAGAVLSFPSFARDHMPLQAVWLSIFHSIAAFNNAGFDALGGGQSLIPYRNDLLLNLVTDALVIVGGIGFMVILDVGRCRGQFRRMTFHTKVVLSTTAVLLVGGAVLLQLTDHMGWLAALFQSMTARTAGFSSVDIGSISNAGLLVIMILMFIGASPGSTGGGIKTTTFFVLMQQVRSIFSKRRLGGFHRRLPDGSLSKAATIMLMGLMVVGCGTFALCVLEPQLDFGRLLFEQISAYSTAGLSTGITAELCPASRVVLILTMFIGRVGAVTLLSLWVERPAPSAQYTEENITIG